MRHHRLQFIKVDHDFAIVGGVGIGGDGHVILRPALHRQVLPGVLVGREDGCCRAEFGAHVGDRGALRNRQRSHSISRVFEDLANSAFHRELTQDIENDVFGGYPGLQFSLQIDPDYFRHGQVECAARHRDCNIQPAGADGQHAQPAVGRCMRIRAQKRLSRYAIPLQVHLVTNAVARARVVDSVARGDTLKILMIVGILETGLKHVVIHVRDGALGLYLVNPKGLKLQVRHCAGCILCQSLIDTYCNRLACGEFALDQVGADDLLDEILTHGMSILCSCDLSNDFTRPFPARHALPARILSRFDRSLTPYAKSGPYAIGQPVPPVQEYPPPQCNRRLLRPRGRGR